MNSNKWTFEPGTREGFTASPVTIFQGARLQATVRETIQNSLDAAKSSPVKVCFSMVTIPMSDAPEIQSLKTSIEKAAHEERVFHNDAALEETEAASFYNTALNSVFGEAEISIFGVHDFNTSGLGGNLVEEQHVKPGQWLALVKGAGVDVKDDAASLGSFGQGAKAPFALSHLRSLFYLSQVENAKPGEELRFQGKALLSSFWDTDDFGNERLRIGTGYYGSNPGQGAILGNEIPDWATSERAKFGEGIGTSILLPAPFGYSKNNPGEFWQLLKIAVLTNFYFALNFKKLEVHLDDGTVLNETTAKAVATELGLLGEVAPNGLDPETLDKLEVLKTLINADERGTQESREFGDIYWAIRVGENAPGKKVGIARKTGMLITRRPPEFLKFPGMGNFDIFVCVVGDKGSQVLRSLENPAHDAFEYERISDPEKLKTAKKKYLSFSREIRDIISQFAKLTGDSEETTADLNELLGGSLDDSSDKQLRVEFPSKTKVSRGVKPIRRVVTEGGDGEGDSGAGGGTGAGGGNSTGGSGSGSGTGKGYKGSKVKAVSGLLFIPLAGATDTYKVYFQAKKTDDSNLVLFKSGDVGREVMDVTISNESLSRVPSSLWNDANSGKDRYFVEIQIKEFAGAIEAGVEN